MSRKHGRFQKRYGKTPHGSGGRRKKMPQGELLGIIKRAMKREYIKRGIIPDPALRPPRYKFTWTYGELGGVVYADDRSTARALIKKDLGIRKKHRLPLEIEITREPNIEDDDNEDSTGSAGEDTECSDHGRETRVLV